MSQYNVNTPDLYFIICLREYSQMANVRSVEFDN